MAFVFFKKMFKNQQINTFMVDFSEATQRNRPYLQDAFEFVFCSSFTYDLYHAFILGKNIILDGNILWNWTSSSRKEPIQ